LINLVKWFNGHKLYKFDEQIDDVNSKNISIQNSKAKKQAKTYKTNKNIT